MSIINSPPTTPVDTQGKDGLLKPPGEGWRHFFNDVFSICNALTMSGTTAQRPTVFLWVGRNYFDTTLGVPIWILIPNPGPIWVDAAGAVV